MQYSSPLNNSQVKSAPLRGFATAQDTELTDWSHWVKQWCQSRNVAHRHRCLLQHIWTK